MKIVYLIHSLCNPGGMERVLLHKVRWLSACGGYELLIVTTDAHGRPPFYVFPETVRMVDLDINYSDDNDRPALAKIASYFRKRRLHHRRLAELLGRERADIVVSLFPSESSFLPDLRDGSKKILELHFGRYFRLQYGRTGILGLADRFRTWQDRRLAQRFDRFVVLTREDRCDWGDMPNICVIPNAAEALSDTPADVSVHRVIAVGRLDYQKSFDRLIAVWAAVTRDPAWPGGDWRLDIFGQGPWRDRLQHQIDTAGISGSVALHAPVTDIGREYVRSAMLVMTSHYEGLPMVMLEAMACGLPVVSFGFKCGPADLIRNGVNGFVVPDGDLDGLKDALLCLMNNLPLRQAQASAALETAAGYSEESVMKKWEDCFRSILS
ncbi:MAG: glycosyltransferase family 4 protein [Bacteroidales bacterium]|nr:glycosyltransferase family 4 protein [Bacteroidales bacterium]